MTKLRLLIALAFLGCLIVLLGSFLNRKVVAENGGMPTWSIVSSDDAYEVARPGTLSLPVTASTRMVWAANIYGLGDSSMISLGDMLQVAGVVIFVVFSLWSLIVAAKIEREAKWQNSVMRAGAR